MTTKTLMLALLLGTAPALAESTSKQTDQAAPSEAKAVEAKTQSDGAASAQNTEGTASVQALTTEGGTTTQTVEAEQTTKVADDENSPVAVETATSAKEPQARQKEFSSGQVKAIEGILADYISKNPDVVAGAMEHFIAKQEERERSSVKKQFEDIQARIPGLQKQLLDTSTATVWKNPNGFKKLVLFYDDNCPACRGFDKLLAEIATEDKELNIILRPWPFLGKDSQDLARVLLAAKDQGKFEELFAAIYSSGERFNREKALEMAKKLDLDMDALKKRMNSEKINKILKVNSELAYDHLKLIGTPTVILGTKDKVELVNLSTHSHQSFKQAVKALSKDGKS